MASKATAGAPASSKAADIAKPRKTRLALQIARRLEDQILGEGWPVGYQIGREAELASEMGVSRWTFREAIRILEGSGFVVSRKGARGGLFVASRAYDFACKMMSNYLQFVQVTEKEFGSVLHALNRLAITEAMKRISADESQRIRDELDLMAGRPLAEQLEVVWAVHESIIRASGNPALQLFIGTFGKMAFDACLYSTLDDAEWLDTFRAVVVTAHSMARAAISRDLHKALAESDAFSVVYCRLFAGSSFHLRTRIVSETAERAYDFFPPARPLKKVDEVERAIREIIFDEAWPVDCSIGSEKELAGRFGVGRWVLRDALRSLEQLGVIEIGRGSRSGVRVVSPNSGAVAESARRYLRREALGQNEEAAVRAVLREVAQDFAPPIPICNLFEQILGA